jgi:predicted SAM-dependent methyltransferase
LRDNVFLDVGCGPFKKEGFLGIDIDPSCNPDIVASMDNIPLPDASVIELRSSHSLEHVTKYDVPRVLQEWKRLLKPGGIAVIEVPDLEWCIHNWLWRKTTDWHMDTIFGQQTSPGEAHRTGFTYDIMADYLRQAGLVLLNFNIVQSHGQPSLRFEVVKPDEPVRLG